MRWPFLGRFDLTTARGREDALDTALAAGALVVALYAVVTPFLVTPYPPMTDLPFHTAQSSAFRHYWDPAFHFHEQFELQPFAVPYLSSYLLAAILMFVLPAVTSAKVAGCVMLGLIPAGFAVMFHGMKKSPVLGLLGLGLTWCALTHWGFLNFMGALGLFAMTIGLTLLLVDRPSRRRQIALGATLIVVWATHVFRFPFAMAAVVGAAIVMYPATRTLKPIFAPLAPSVLLLGVWNFARPKGLQTDGMKLVFTPKRMDEFARDLTGAFYDPAEHQAFETFWRIVLVTFVLCVAIRGVELALALQRTPKKSKKKRAKLLPTRQELAWDIGTTVIPLACAGVFLILFLTLPMELGSWWYVYPREATAAAMIALGAFPDLPRPFLARAPLAGALAFGGIGVANVVIDNYRKFGVTTEDFTAIVKEIPAAPKLLYLVFDRDGGQRTSPPFIHFPAYVQAEKGGWLSFHFAVLDTSPVKYRPRDEPGAVVPPPVPTRWEWTPQLFDVKKQAPFFDTFLVKSRVSPDALFRADPTIERVDHIGSWWLYRRRAEP